MPIQIFAIPQLLTIDMAPRDNIFNRLRVAIALLLKSGAHAERRECPDNDPMTKTETFFRLVVEPIRFLFLQ